MQSQIQIHSILVTCDLEYKIAHIRQAVLTVAVSTVETRTIYDTFAFASVWTCQSEVTDLSDSAHIQQLETAQTNYIGYSHFPNNHNAEM